MIDPPLPGALSRLRRFIREFLPLLRYMEKEPDLLVVTADPSRSQVYERLLQRHRAIQKLALGELCHRVKTYAVKPPVPSITGLTWKGHNQDASVEYSQEFPDHRYGYSRDNRMDQRRSEEAIFEPKTAGQLRHISRLRLEKQEAFGDHPIAPRTATPNLFYLF